MQPLKIEAIFIHLSFLTFLVGTGDVTVREIFAKNYWRAFSKRRILQRLGRQASSPTQVVAFLIRCFDKIR